VIHDPHADARSDPLVTRLRVQVAEFAAREIDARAGAPDGVHRMRVAARRIRSCLGSFRPAFARESVRHLRRELKWIGDLLGADRDAEVILDRIARDIGELAGADPAEGLPPDAEVRGPGEPGATHDALLTAFDSSRFGSLLDELAAFAAGPVLARRPRSEKWRVGRLVREIRQVESLVAEADRCPLSARDGALHEVRKAAKQARYAAETLVSEFGGKAKRVADAFESVQTVLGEHHDAVVTRQVLESESARVRAMYHARGVDPGVLIAREVERANQAEAAFVKEWARVRRLVRKHWPKI
jgi:CHAD domain-containing protein